MSEVALTVDGRLVSVPEGATVLDAARAAGIYVPTLCYDEELGPYGACRLCIVEIEGVKGLPTACTTRAAQGMIVRTDTDIVHRIRRAICQMLIADHPLDCLACSSNQRCELQKVAAYLGLAERRMEKLQREQAVDQSNPFFSRDMAKCILCGRCVRMCQERRWVGAIEFVGRGYESRVATFQDRPILESTCESCGDCVDRCPVGALAVKKETLPPTEEVKTICPYCGCGCGMVLGVRQNRIVRVRGDGSNPASHGQLCVKGRFGLDFVGSADRLKTPLVRRGGKLQEATWDEALELVASGLRNIKEKHGPDAIAGLSSAKCTNEENYVFQKFMRAAVGTNNVDHCARLCHASTVAGLSRAFGSGAMTNSIDEIEHARCILVTGSNTTEAHPIIALRIKAAVQKRGAVLIVADPRRIDLVWFARLHLQHRAGTDVMLFNAMMNAIVVEGLHNREFIALRTEGFADAWAAIEPCTPEAAAMVTGVPADDIRQAARLFATAECASIVYSMGITQHTTGTDNVLALANLAMLTGNVGKPFAGVNPLRGQNNVQGACDMGALPDLLPGYQRVDDRAALAKFQEAWQTSLSGRPGLTVVEMMHAAEQGKVRAMYIMGENPVLSDPNSNRVKKALNKLDLLVVQDIFLSETAELADVVLPGVCFAEKEGTFTNTERRVQLVRRAVNPPGNARQDWQIVCDVAGRLGYPMVYEGPSQIMDEVARLTPIYGGISHARLANATVQWPCPTSDHPGTPYLHKERFSRGLGKFHPTPFREAAELPDRRYPFILSTGRLLYHFHTGTLSRQSPGLEQICPPGSIEVNPEDAAKVGIKHGDAVQVASRRGRIVARAFVTPRVRQGMLFMPFHFRECPANVLTNDALDEVAEIPEFKVCAARLQKVRAAPTRNKRKRASRSPKAS